MFLGKPFRIGQVAVDEIFDCVHCMIDSVGWVCGYEAINKNRVCKNFFQFFFGLPNSPICKSKFGPTMFYLTMFSCLHRVTICKSKTYPILTYKLLLKKHRRITLHYLQCNIRQYITIPSLIRQYNIKNCIVISYNFLLYNFFEIYLGIISFNSFESFLYNHPPNTFPISLYLYWQNTFGEYPFAPSGPICIPNPLAQTFVPTIPSCLSIHSQSIPNTLPILFLIHCQYIYFFIFYRIVLTFIFPCNAFFFVFYRIVMHTIPPTLLWGSTLLQFYTVLY